MLLLILFGIVSQSLADLPEVPAECARGTCTKVLSITTNVATNFGYSRNGVKAGVWINKTEDKLTQIIFHQPKNAPLHDVINLVSTKAYSPNQDRVVLKDDDTEVMLKFNSGCAPGDFAARSCTRFDMKLKTASNPDHWTSVTLEIEDDHLVLIEQTGRRNVSTLLLNALVDKLGMFGSETKAHFTSIRFSP